MYGFLRFDIDFYVPHLAIATNIHVVYKSLKRRIYVDTQDDSFVQCVSPKHYKRRRWISY
jgi:hypothetical protein